jgi:hypothetical protein
VTVEEVTVEEVTVEGVTGEADVKDNLENRQANLLKKQITIHKLGC